MVTSFLKFEKIETTDAKAKELRRVAEKMITLAKRGGLHARRQAAAVIRDKDVVKKLFDEIGARFADRQGGYTRIVKTRFRAGDSATMAIIELTSRPAAEKKDKKESKAKKEPKAKKEAKPKAEKEKTKKAEKAPKAVKEAKPKKVSTKKATAKKEAGKEK
jgi:large subunit ribosomal protein L17